MDYDINFRYGQHSATINNLPTRIALIPSIPVDINDSYLTYNFRKSAKVMTPDIMIKRWRSAVPTELKKGRLPRLDDDLIFFVFRIVPEAKYEGMTDLTELLDACENIIFNSRDQIKHLEYKVFTHATISVTIAFAIEYNESIGQLDFIITNQDVLDIVNSLRVANAEQSYK